MFTYSETVNQRGKEIEEHVDFGFVKKIFKVTKIN